MNRIPAGPLIWSLKRYTKNTNLWDRVCFTCQQATPVFEYEARNEQQPIFNYLCERCAQKKITEWLHSAANSDNQHPDDQTHFDVATVFYEQKNDAETLMMIRWSPEQRRRRLQGEQQ
jgi:protein-arginine kinase activator protein McsA